MKYCVIFSLLILLCFPALAKESNDVSRYEIADSIAKSEKSIKQKGGVNEKILAELKSELSIIKYERENEAKETQFSGEFESAARYSMTDPQWGRPSYR